MLYRHYRPATFDDIIGQELIVQVLRSQVVADRVGHAYLLSGPRGTGKTSIARILARAVNCTGKKSVGKTTPIPCGACDFCIAAEKGTMLDIIEMDAASHRGIDDIRVLREAVHVQPVIGRRKVYIIDEVHMLTTEAFNALLKTLEEPPAHILFILATTDVEKVPATIISRTQMLPFEALSRAELIAVITRAAEGEGWTIEPAAADVLARAAHGGARDVLTLLERSFGMMEGTTTIGLVDVERLLGQPAWDVVVATVTAMLERDTLALVRLVRGFADDRRALDGWAEAVLAAIRSMTLLSAVPSLMTDDLSDEQRSTLLGLTAKTSTHALLALARTWIEGMEHAAKMDDAVLAYELMVMQIGAGQAVRATQTASTPPAAPSVAPRTPTPVAQTPTPSPRVAAPMPKSAPSAPVKANVEPLDPKSLMDLSELVVHWGDVVSHMRTENFSVGGLLSMAIPIQGPRGEIIGVLPHRFHAERLHRPAVHDKILSELESRTGKRVHMSWKGEQDLTDDERVRYQEEQEKRSKEGSDFLALAQDLLGGEQRSGEASGVAPDLAIS